MNRAVARRARPASMGRAVAASIALVILAISYAAGVFATGLLRAAGTYGKVCPAQPLGRLRPAVPYGRLAASIVLCTVAARITQWKAAAWGARALRCSSTALVLQPAPPRWPTPQVGMAAFMALVATAVATQNRGPIAGWGMHACGPHQAMRSTLPARSLGLPWWRDGRRLGGRHKLLLRHQAGQAPQVPGPCACVEEVWFHHLDQHVLQLQLWLRAGCQGDLWLRRAQRPDARH